MKYCSTRGAESSVNFEKVVLKGLASDGGLYVPEEFPFFDKEFIFSLKGLSYGEFAYHITKNFVSDSIPFKKYREICEKTYLNFSPKSKIIELLKIKKNESILNLHNGPTYAFKDFALQLLGNIYEYFLNKNKEKLVILGATSGDTGSAAIHGCAKCDLVKIFILFPHKKVSQIQRRQMTTVIKSNVFNIAIKGNFDDCQSLVKEFFKKNEKSKFFNLAAINSINWVRIMGQIVYYFWSYLEFCKEKEDIIYSVPTGNFGNVYAGFVAKKMGLPIKNLIVSSNSNDVLTEFFCNGSMKKKKTIKTLSPSMDIQVSSNFERLLFYFLKNNGKKLKEFYESLEKKGKFKVDKNLLNNILSTFSGGKIDDEETKTTIKEVYTKHNIIVDPHTAVGINIGRKLNVNDEKIIFLSTAHYAKFLNTVEDSINTELILPSDLSNITNKEERFDILNSDIIELESFLLNNC